MALNRKQKIKSLFYLGWAAITIIPTSTHFNSVVNDRIDAASDDDDISRLIKDLLEKLENIDECLEKAKCRLAASKVDNITMNKNEIHELNKERRRCIRELSDTLDVPIMRSGGSVVGVCN